jgi:hypothetical protein
MTWILIVYIGSSQLYLPLTAHPSEEDCNRALEEWMFQPGWHGTCLPGTIEPDDEPTKRSRSGRKR